MPETETLDRDFYARPTVAVATDLLGKILVHGKTAGIIVETEAYPGGDDLASHSARGITNRTRVIFGAPGHAYVYLIYGVYRCLNIVAEPDGLPGCVLIRAIEPTRGVEIMRRRRPAVKRTELLANGPGKLTLALGITGDHYGVDVTTGPLLVQRQTPPPRFEIKTTRRIGITHCADRPLRFLIKDNPFVSHG